MMVRDRSSEFSKVIQVNELQEGDIILLGGRAISSKLIAFWSKGSSHVGQMMNLDGKLWLVESVSWKTNGGDEPIDSYVDKNGKGCCFSSGIVATALPQLVKYYATTGVFRPTPALNENELSAMRREFQRMHGLGYEMSVTRLTNAVASLPRKKPRKKFFCSQLTAHLFRLIGRLRKEYSKRRYNSGDYLPSDIVDAIDTNYKGHFQGTQPFRKLKKVRNA